VAKCDQSGLRRLSSLGRLANIFTPLFDGMELCLCVVFLLVEAFRFFVSLKPLASLLAAVSFFLPHLLGLLPPSLCVCLLLQDLVQSCLRGGGGILEDMCYERRLWLVREVIELGLKYRQALVTCREHSAECLHPFLERRPILHLARKMEQVVFLPYALARSHADARRGSRTWERGPEPPKRYTAELGRHLDRRGAWLRMSRRRVAPRNGGLTSFYFLQREILQGT
jgi:hypothetical protein